MIIDVHGHLSSPESVRRFPMPASLGDVEGMIERKLAHGIGVTVIGSPVGAGAMVPAAGTDNYAQSDDALASFHDWIAQTVDAHPDHLRGYVYVNPFGDERHLERAERTARSEQFVGFIANSSVRGEYAVGPECDDFYMMVARTGLPLLLHAPALPAAAAGLRDPMAVEQLGRFCDVAIGVAQMILDGVFDRHPELRLIVPGVGGALALLAERLDMAAAAPHWVGGARRSAPLAAPPSEYFSRLMVDTATTSPAALTAMLDRFGAERMLVGTDSPPLSESAIATPLSILTELVPDQAELSQIHTGNARALFGDRLPPSAVADAPSTHVGSTP